VITRMMLPRVTTFAGFLVGIDEAPPV